MSKKIKQLRLEVVHGPNKGAYVSLKDGVYSVGKSEKCDLILNDTALQDHHIDIFLKQGDITVSTMGSDVWVEGKLCSSFHKKLNLYDIITIGSSHIAIGPDEVKWPLLTPPIPENIENDSAFTTDALVSNSGVLTDDRRVDAIEGKLELAKKPYKSTSRVAVSALLISSVVLLILVVGLVVPVQAIMQKSPVDKGIKTIIQEYNLQDSVSVKHKGNGEVHLTGYVDNNRILNNLISSIVSKNDKVIISVKNTEVLANRSREILQAMGFNHIHIQGSESGKLIAKGYVANKTDWGQAKSLIIKDVNGVHIIEDSQVYTLDHIATEMTEKIANKSLDKWIRVDIRNKFLDVIGKIPKHKQSEWRSIVNDFKEKYGNEINVGNEVIVTKKLKIILPIKSVSISTTPYLTIDNNKKYIEGSIIGKEYTIQAIKSDRVVIEDSSGNTFDYLINESGS